MNYLEILNLVYSAIKLEREDLRLNLTRIPAPGSCGQSAANNTNTIVSVIKVDSRTETRYVILKSRMWQTEDISSIEICDLDMNTIVKSHDSFSSESGYARFIIDLIKTNF